MNTNKQIRRNANGVNLEKNIESGRTKFFEFADRDKAIEYKIYQNTYMEDCFIVVENDKGFEYKLVGYTVPA